MKGIQSHKKGSYGTKGKHTLPKRLTFQKKLIVIKYMGENAPKKFTLKDRIVALRGLLPDIDMQASELDVRSEIAGVICNSGEEMSACSRHSFEFIAATGKHLCVPAKPKGFRWSGKVVKNLAGCGQVYVRLLYSPDTSSESSCDLPSVFNQDHDDVVITEPHSSQLPSYSIPTQQLIGSQQQPPLDSRMPSNSVTTQPTGTTSNPGTTHPTGALSIPGTTHPTGTTGMPSIPGTSYPTGGSGMLSIPGTTHPTGMTGMPSIPGTTHPTGATGMPSIPETTQWHESAEVGIMQLCQMFPHVSERCLKYVYELCSGNLVYAADCLLSGPSIENLVAILQSLVITECEGRKLKIEDDQQSGDELIDRVLAYYKGPRFDPHSEVHIFLNRQPAIDAGGMRRRVFSEVFKTIAFSARLGLFEGPPVRLKPAFRISSLSAGVMKLLGCVIGHSIILDCQGFPYLSPACYKLMVGDQNQGLPFCTPEDASERVQRVLKEVSYFYCCMTLV